MLRRYWWLKKGTISGKYHAIHRYAKANNKCMKTYNKNKVYSYIQYLDGNDLYWWEISQKLSVMV